MSNPLDNPQEDGVAGGFTAGGFRGLLSHSMSFPRFPTVAFRPVMLALSGQVRLE